MKKDVATRKAGRGKLEPVLRTRTEGMKLTPQELDGQKNDGPHERRSTQVHRHSAKQRNRVRGCKFEFTL